MGRSGTSAVAGMFAAAGFHPGESAELMPADAANPRGYFEHVAVYELNESILSALGATWFDPPGWRAQVAAPAWASSEARTLTEHLLARARPAPTVLKDPRIGVLPAIWGGALKELLHPILVVRDPLEIAASLVRRDGTTPAAALAAWEIHTRMLLRALRGQVVTVAPHRELLSQLHLAMVLVATAASHLDRNFSERVDPRAASRHLDRSLWRDRVLRGAHPAQLTNSQLTLWQWLDSLRPGDHQLTPPLELCAENFQARETISEDRERWIRCELLRIDAKRRAIASRGDADCRDQATSALGIGSSA
jgi:hypothetical protein